MGPPIAPRCSNPAVVALIRTEYEPWYFKKKSVYRSLLPATLISAAVVNGTAFDRFVGVFVPSGNGGGNMAGARWNEPDLHNLGPIIRCP